LNLIWSISEKCYQVPYVLSINELTAAQVGRDFCLAQQYPEAPKHFLDTLAFLFFSSLILYSAEAR
jgi:hypothetical protein